MTHVRCACACVAGHHALLPEEVLGCAADKVVYFGDHITCDVVVTRKVLPALCLHTIPDAPCTLWSCVASGFGARDSEEACEVHTSSDGLIRHGVAEITLASPRHRRRGPPTVSLFQPRCRIFVGPVLRLRRRSSGRRKGWRRKGERWEGNAKLVRGMCARACFGDNRGYG